MRTEVKTLVSVLVLEVELKLSTIDHTASENMLENPSQTRTQRIYTKISTVLLVRREMKWNYTLRMLNYNLLQLLKDSISHLALTFLSAISEFYYCI
jgi:hypothetical protein